MKTRISSNKEGIDIEITEVSGDRVNLLKAFQECQEGKCSCPTQEYTKVDSLEVENTENSIHLFIKAKYGEIINKEEIRKCLEYSTRKTSNK